MTDEGVPYAADSLRYRLKQVDLDDSTTLTDPVTVARGGPAALELLGTGPNPASQQVTIRYAVPEGTEGDVQMRLYDVLGRQMRTVPVRTDAGRHTKKISVASLASGVYFLRLRGDGTTKTQKLTVVQ